MNVLMFESKKLITSTLCWSLALSFFGCVCIGLFSAFSQNMAVFESMFNAYSPEMLKAVGANVTLLTTTEGFYSFYFMYIVMAFSFFALLTSLKVISVESSGNIQDYLYTKPISRIKIIFSKLISVILMNALLCLIYTFIIFVFIKINAFPMNTNVFLLMHIGLFMTQLLFVSLGLLLGCVFKKIKSIISVCSCVIFIFFVLQMIINMDSESVFRFVSLLSYADSNNIVMNQTLDLSYVLGALIIIVGCKIFSFYKFNHKDL